MIRALIKLKRRRVLLNIDAQKDFFLADGNACIRNHRRVLMNIRRINAWARVHSVRTISTALINTSGHLEHQDYCIDGSDGATILNYTRRNRCISYSADGYADLRKDVFENFDQIILEKRTSNPFNEPRVDRLLSELAVDEIIVVGALAEHAVFETVLGLLQRGKKVTVVSDATGSRDKDQAEMALKKMEAKGAKMIETKDLAGLGHLHLVGACHCERCQGKIKKLAI